MNFLSINLAPQSRVPAGGAPVQAIDPDTPCFENLVRPGTRKACIAWRTSVTAIPASTCLPAEHAS